MKDRFYGVQKHSESGKAGKVAEDVIAADCLALDPAAAKPRGTRGLGARRAASALSKIGRP